MTHNNVPIELVIKCVLHTYTMAVLQAQLKEYPVNDCRVRPSFSVAIIASSTTDFILFWLREHFEAIPYEM